MIQLLDAAAVEQWETDNQRQLLHNNGSGIVFGYHKDDTDAFLAKLVAELESERRITLAMADSLGEAVEILGGDEHDLAPHVAREVIAQRDGMLAALKAIVFAVKPDHNDDSHHHGDAYHLASQAIADFDPEPELADAIGGEVELPSPNLSQNMNATYDAAYAHGLKDGEAKALASMVRMGVGTGDGNLFVYGDYDSIKAAQMIVIAGESARQSLATNSRLLEERHKDIQQLADRIEQLVFNNNGLIEEREQLRAKLRDATEQQPIGSFTGKFYGGIDSPTFFEVKCFDALPKAGSYVYSGPAPKPEPAGAAPDNKLDTEQDAREPVEFYSPSTQSYYNTMRAALKDGCNDAEPIFATAAQSDYSGELQDLLDEMRLNPHHNNAGKVVSYNVSHHTVRDLIALLSKLSANAFAESKQEPVAEVRSKYGDPEAFGERHLHVFVDLKGFKYGTKLYADPQPAQAAVVPDELPVHVLDAVSEALGDCYDCMRTWQAWSYGTMTQNDFQQVAESSERVEEIARAAITAYVGSQQAVTAQPVEHDSTDVVRSLLHPKQADAYTAALAFVRECEENTGHEPHPSMVGRAFDELIEALQSAPAVSVPDLDGVDGDILPPVGASVAIHLASCDKWVDHTVVGYYVWGPLGGIDSAYSRVFVRVVDGQGILNARLLKDVKWDKNIPLRAIKSPHITEQAIGDYITGDCYEAGLWSRRNIEAFIEDGNTIGGSNVPDGYRLIAWPATEAMKPVVRERGGAQALAHALAAISDMLEACKPAPDRSGMYYCKVEGCKAKLPSSADCICWHKIGTGPLPNVQHDHGGAS